MFWDGELVSAKAAAMRKKMRKARKGDAEDDVEDDDHELSEEEINLVHSHCRGVFGTVIADEA